MAAITLVLALTLLLSGFRDGIDVETARTVRALGGDGFVVREGVAGPFTTLSQLHEDVAGDLSYAPGVRRADPIVSIRHAIESSPVTDVYLVGARPGGLGMARVTTGRAVRSRGETVLDGRGGRQVGDQVRLGGRSFKVVGLVRGITVWAGVPTMFVSLEDAQDLIFTGAPSATAVVVSGRPATLPPGLRLVRADQARLDLKRPLANAITTIDLLRLFLWVVAAAIVASVLYVSALERSRDFAVFEAFGTNSRDLVGTLMVQALVLAALSAARASGVIDHGPGHGLRPRHDDPLHPQRHASASEHVFDRRSYAGPAQEARALTTRSRDRVANGPRGLCRLRRRRSSVRACSMTSTVDLGPELAQGRFRLARRLGEVAYRESPYSGASVGSA